MNQNLIARHFQRSQATYDTHAVVQKNMAETMVEVLASLNVKFSRVLELGCGVLTLTRPLLKHLQVKEIFLNDLWDPPRASLSWNGTVKTLVGDAEKIEWPKELDLVAANAVVQWFNSPLRVLNLAFQAVRPGGVLALGLFLPGTFDEFQTVTGKGLSYPTDSVWKETAHKVGWFFKQDQAIEKTLHFERPLDVLRHIQATGVGATEECVWTRSALAQFEKNYPRSQDQTCPLSYTAKVVLWQRE
ncbi:MAG: methyltransferase domain-containing protein [Spirochaetales bacterium]|nr:methyltransferase domain-containing protein [Spirochaetales bacterium]